MPPWFWKLLQDIAPAVVIALGGWMLRLAHRLKAEREANQRVQAGFVALVQRVREVADVARVALFLAEERINELAEDKKEYLRRKVSRITDELHEAQGYERLRRSKERGADLRAITLALGREETEALREAIRKGPA